MVQFLLEQKAPSPLAAIWLGGAYGRGEGAVFKTAEQERPWFDYDLYLVYSQPDTSGQLPALLARWSASLSVHFAMDVQLRSPGDAQAIATLESKLGWYDLSLGYQVLWGDADLVPQLRGGPMLPPETPLNLLIYWGGKLLEMQLGEPEPDTWYRIIAALGDAWLLSQDLYHVSLQERAQRFHTWQREHGLAWSRELGYLYQEALQYRLLPSDFVHMREQLSARWPRLAALFVQVYLAIFAHEVYKPVSLTRFERLFLERRQIRPAAWQLRHLLANLRQYHGRSFNKGWYSRPLLHRLYFLLPFLLENQLPAPASLSRVLPDLPADADFARVEQEFFKLWKLVEGELV